MDFHGINKNCPKFGKDGKKEYNHLKRNITFYDNAVYIDKSEVYVSMHLKLI